MEVFLVSSVLFLGTLQNKQNLSSFAAVNLSSQPIETAGEKYTLRGLSLRRSLRSRLALTDPQ